jgi:hypothetical protein
MRSVTELADFCKKSILRVVDKSMIDMNFAPKASFYLISNFMMVSLTNASTCFRLIALKESEFSEISCNWSLIIAREVLNTIIILYIDRLFCFSNLWKNNLKIV